MGTEETSCDEEGFIPFFGHELDCFGGDHAVGLFFVGAIGSEPTKGSADLAVGFGVEDEVLVGFVAAEGIDDALPGWFVVEAISADAGGDVVVVDFANAGHVVAILDEMLGKRDGVGDGSTEMLVEVVDFDLVGTEPGHDGGPAGIAERELIVGLVEADALGGEAVDMGSFDDEIAIAAEGSSEIIDGDEEDIRLFCVGAADDEDGEESGDHVDGEFSHWGRLVSREKNSGLSFGAGSVTGGRAQGIYQDLRMTDERT